MVESDRVRPPAPRRNLEARLSEGRINELDIKARANVDPETAEEINSSAVDNGRVGLDDDGTSVGPFLCFELPGEVLSLGDDLGGGVCDWSCGVCKHQLIFWMVRLTRRLNSSKSGILPK